MRWVLLPRAASDWFYDVRVDDQNIALKSAKAKTVPKSTIHSSKLCEAAWIQDARSKAMRSWESGSGHASVFSAAATASRSGSSGPSSTLSRLEGWCIPR